MKKNIQQKHNRRETLKIQETNLPTKPRRLLFLGPLFIGIIGFVLIFLSAGNNGLGLSGDSVGYISWARNLLENHSFTQHDGSYLLAWPPLYPVIIAFFKLCGINEFLCTRLINAVSFSLIIFVSGLCILKYSGSLTFSVIGSIFTLLSKPLVSVCCWAWSEPLFIVLVTVFLLLVPKVIKNPTFKSTLLLAVVTSAACMTRYVGIVLLPIGAVVLFFGIKHFRRKVIFTSFWGVVSVLPFGIWLLRNRILSGTAMGARLPSSLTMLQNIKTAGDVIGSWFILQDPKEFTAGGLIFALFSIFVSAVSAVYIYKIIKSKEADWLIITVLLFLALYMTAIIYSATSTSMDFIDDRLLSPLYPAIVILMGILVINLFGPGSNFSQIKNRSSRRIIRYGLIAGICIGISIWAYTGFYYTMAMTQQLSKIGFGFSSSYWKISDTIAWLKSNKLNGKIYTNETNGIYILADINAYMLPVKSDYFKNISQSRRKDMEKQLLEFKSALKTGESVYLVWFARHFRKYLYDPQELQQFCNMNIIKELNDGVIIALYPK